MSFLTEIRRRGVVQMAVAYLVVSWLVVQVSDILLPIFAAPDWILRSLVILLAVGFPISLILAWFYNLTTEGVKLDQTPETEGNHAAFPGQTINYFIIGVLASAVILFALDKFFWQSELPFDDSTDNPAIAVLPFRNLSGDAANDPFAQGIHDDLITHLSRIRSLSTVSRASVMGFADRDLPIPQIAERLSANFVLEGGVQRSGDRIRVSAQLIDGKNDLNLWAETYDHLLTAENIFSIQSEISRAIAQTLNATLSPDEEQALAKVPTQSLEAWEAYAAGRSGIGSTSAQDLDYAIEHFQSAIRSDPDFAAAWAGLCRAHLNEYSMGRDRESFDAAEAACERALQLDDSRVEVYVALGTLYRHFGQYSKAEVALQRANYEKAEAALNQALTLDAVELDALVELGNVLARQGEQIKAEETLLEAEKQDPKSWTAQTALFTFYYNFSDQPDRFRRAASHASKSASLRPELAASWNNLGAANYMMGEYELAADAWEESLQIEPNRTGFTNTGLALYYSGQFEEALVMQQKAIEQAPSDHRAMGRLGDALRHIGGREAEALAAYEEATDLAERQLAVNDRNWKILAQLATYQAYLGNTDRARDLITRAQRWSDHNGETYYQLAVIEAAGGRHEAALNALSEALSRVPGYLNLAKTEPDFQPLQSMPEFQVLLAAERR